MLNIHVLSRDGMQRFADQKHSFDSFVISIRDPDRKQLVFDVLGPSGIFAVHYFKFWDETEPEHGAMTENDAQLLAKFVLEEVKSRPDAHLAVNCEGGVSRSAGVAAAISKYFNGDDSIYFKSRYVPNMRCYRLVLNALHKHGGKHAERNASTSRN